jgi:hypothetical protein
MKLSGVGLTQSIPPNLNTSTLVPEKQNTESNKRKIKIKMKINTQRNSRICCGVPPMSAKFNVFSQTVRLHTVVEQIHFKDSSNPLQKSRNPTTEDKCNL